MRPRSIVAATAAITTLMLAAAVPAHADVITTDEVTDVVVVHTTDENFRYGAYTPWEAEGPAVFPSTVLSGAGGSYVLNGYRPALPTLAEGCTRTIDAFTVEYRGLISGLGSSETSFYVGTPASSVPVDVDFDGTGTATATSDFTTVSAVDGQNSGTISFALETPVADTTALLGFIGFFTNAGTAGDPLFSVDSVSFATTTTCPDPVEEEPAAAPADVDVLPDTGIDSASALIAGGVALGVIALGVVLTLLRRRRAAE